MKKLEDEFPRLRTTRYAVTSPRTIAYNCIAWAAGRSDTWWWPDPNFQYYWPPGIPRSETVDAFVTAFGFLGYKRCNDSGVEPGYEKIAVFVGTDGRPTHGARQLANGAWTSKLGREEDIEHESLESLIGSDYGRPTVFLKRRLQIHDQ